jgi:hypothetical protein
MTRIFLRSFVSFYFFFFKISWLITNLLCFSDKALNFVVSTSLLLHPLKMLLGRLNSICLFNQTRRKNFTLWLQFSLHFFWYSYFLFFLLLLCWVEIHCGIYKSSYNISNISFLNSPPPPFSFISPHPILGIILTGIIFHLLCIQYLH